MIMEARLHAIAAQLSAATGANVAVGSVIAYFVLCFLPHVVSFNIATGGDPSKHDNTNPRSASHAESLKKRLGPARHAAYERARACHQNHLENLPVLIGAVLAGILAEQRLQSPILGGGAGLTRTAAAERIGVDAFAVGWMLLRSVYTINYLTATSRGASFIRSLCYLGGSAWAMTIFARAAKALV